MTDSVPDPLDPPSTRPPVDDLTRIRAAAARFAHVLADGDLQARVPACPDWTLAELADHLGGIHQWGRHAIVHGNPDGDPTRAPSDRPGLVDWYAACVGELVEVLRDTPPDAPVWTFGPRPRTAAFWHRRMAHELAIHLWDATDSQGSPRPTDLLDDDFAADGLAEVHSVFFPRQVRLRRIGPLPVALALQAHRTGAGRRDVAPADVAPAASADAVSAGLGRWVLAGNGLGPESASDAPADATLAGPARDLLLVLWRRLALVDAQVVVAGDRAVVETVLATHLVP